jgi:asparagine synthase (glutamine-hydrolysing)
MCGFASIVTLSGGAPPGEALDRMLASIVHRGPDDAGRAVAGPVSLGFRRLSILDLSPLGHQPMDTEDGNCTIVFNGEIFNFIELREQLFALGHRFRSNGDTEVLLAAYRQWGSDCVSHLNGMWAFLILDRQRGVLFGARDRFGIKPLYRWRDARFCVFASEIKSIRASGLYPDALNLRTCADFLHDGRLDETGATFYAGIDQVPAGHAFELTLAGAYRQWAYWDVQGTAETPRADPAADFADLFEDAMRVHMRSDVPVGVNLSGGLDSTSILCAAARLRAQAGTNSALLAFCYQDRGFDESRYIRDTLAQTGAQLVPLEMKPMELWDSLPRVLGFQDEPVHSMTALVGYHLMALAARNGVKVILNGQGADEVLGGYGNYFVDRWSELIRAGHPLRAWHEVVAYTRAHGGSARHRFGRALRQVAKGALGSSASYRTLAERRHAASAAACNWLQPDLARHLVVPGQRVPIGLRRVLADSMTRTPLPLYLRVEDRNSMAHSIEVRLPFLDHRLVSLAFSLGSEWKVRGPWNKHLLREAMRGRIPESVRARVDKMGFPTDASNWFKGPLYERLRDVIHDSAFQQNPLFNAAVLSTDLEAHRTGKAERADRLFTAAQFHLWQQACGLHA